MKQLASVSLAQLSCLVVFAATFCCGHMIGFLPPHRQAKAEPDPVPTPPVCSTPECRHAATEVETSLDPDVDPCEDFYAFACGGWVRANPVPPTEGQRGRFDLVQETLQKQLKDLLDSDWSESDLTAVGFARATYDACVDEVALESAGLAPLAQLSRRLGSWPMASPGPFLAEQFDAFLVAAEMKRLADIAPLVDVGVKPDMKQAGLHVVKVDQAELFLPRSILVDAQTYLSLHSAYTELIADMALVLARANGLHVARDTLMREATEVVHFEIELAKLTAREEMRRAAFRVYNPMKLTELQQWTDSASFQGRQPTLDWLRLLRALFNDLGVEVDQQQRVVVAEVDFLFRLVVLLDATPPRTVANFLHSRLVLSKASDSTKELRQLSFLFHKLLLGVTEEKPRWETCVAKTSSLLDHALGFAYVRRHFDKESKAAAQQMVSDIRAAFAERIASSKWLDPETRSLALEKAAALTDLVGYPDWYDNVTAVVEYYDKVNVSTGHFSNTVNLAAFHHRKEFERLRKPVDKNRWMMSAQVVNAAYSPTANSIVIPAGILHPPGFLRGRPASLNYGGMGMIIGHELTHGFDDVGRQFDSRGQLTDWWSTQAMEAYVGKARCFVDQYSGYRVPRLDEMVNGTASLNGALSQGENIADCGGLNAAFSAYQRHVREHGPEPPLPGLERFSAEQLFFIGAASVWCESITAEQLLQGLLDDVHSPNEYRVRGPMSNSPAFATAFSCAGDKPMNPPNKCAIW